MKKKKSKRKKKDFDEKFDRGEIEIDFSDGNLNDGLSKTKKLPPIVIPAWVSVEIESLSKIQANSKASVVRQLLVEALKNRKSA